LSPGAKERSRPSRNPSSTWMRWINTQRF
jgi:hypothetical protein